MSVDTLQPPPPPFYFPAPLSVAEAECCTTVLKLTSAGPLGEVRTSGPPCCWGQRSRTCIRQPASEPKRERAEINGTLLVIETSETCSAVSRAALDVLLICMNPTIWGAYRNLTCSPELCSTVRNVDLDLFNYRTRKTFHIMAIEKPHNLRCRCCFFFFVDEIG